MKSDVNKIYKIDKAYISFIAIIIAYLLTAIIATIPFPIKYNWELQIERFLISIIAGPIFAFFAYAIYVMTIVRPARLTRTLVADTRNYLTRSRITNALPILILFPIFTTTFTYFKVAIATINPYSWDSKLSAYDFMIHGGVYPWEWLHPIVGYPFVSSSINFLYHLWFFFMYATVYWLAFSTNMQSLRMHFLLSFVLSWIVLGTIVATAFSSVGPCYYGDIVPGENPYDGLMNYLHRASAHAPMWALDVQKMLWDEYQNQTAVLGISAMPSMHVATSVLLALLGLQINRKLGIALTIYAAIIMVGSVHLGWHYAVDGYIGAIGAYMIWRIVGWALSYSTQQKILSTALPHPTH